MRLTTKARYAVTAMLDIAMYGQTGAVRVSDVSKRQGISRSYLERLLGRLHQCGLVESTHGPGGGYQLAKDMEQISIANIVDAVEESVDATQCHGTRDCRDGEQCMTHELWENLNHHIRRYLSSVSLATVIKEHEDKDAVRFKQPWTPIKDKRVASGVSESEAN